MRQVFYQLLERCRQIAGAKKFRFKNKLLTLDATVIDLCAEMFEWAAFRRTKGAVKLHFTLDHDGYLPDGADDHRRQTLRHCGWRASRRLLPGTILILDRGYTRFRIGSPG